MILRHLVGWFSAKGSFVQSTELIIACIEGMCWLSYCITCVYVRTYLSALKNPSCEALVRCVIINVNFFSLLISLFFFFIIMGRSKKQRSSLLSSSSEVADPIEVSTHSENHSPATGDKRLGKRSVSYQGTRRSNPVQTLSLIIHFNHHNLFSLSLSLCTSSVSSPTKTPTEEVTLMTISNPGNGYDQ